MSDLSPIDTQRRDLAQSYEAMMALGAWKHFQEQVLLKIKAQATKDEDGLPIHEFNLARLAECRGQRKAIDKILADLDYIVHGLR